MGRWVIQRLRAVGLATALVGWSFISPRVPMRWRVPMQAGVGGLLVWLTRAPLGLRPPRLWAGLRLGLTAGATAAAATAAATSIPAVRWSMSARQPPASTAAWLGYQIPFNTVWAEEAGFRAALATAAADALGRPGARLLQAAAFGLSHIPDARAVGEPLTATVVATGTAGWLLGWLADRSGSLIAPILLHLAINETAAVAVLAVHRRSGGNPATS